MRIAYRRRAACDGHHPAADGMSGHGDRRAAARAYLALRWRHLVRSEGPVAGMAGGQAHAELFVVSMIFSENRFPLFGIMLYPGSRDFRIVASTIAAARTLGGWLPVDRMESMRAKAS